MNFRVFFLTITIHRNPISAADIQHERQIQKAMDDVKERQTPYCNYL
ncbi:YrzI family small protein [Bacillus gaemokensis]|nr:YrzI family small protein [Bacillus gaemokensis]KYG34723.1 sporulation protein [Bacillus gaemokensis]